MAAQHGRSGSEPTVTVVIPAWGPRYVGTLPRAIASVRSQAADTPIIVVDNAAEADVGEPAGVEVVRSRRRLSAGAARNLGLERVRSEAVVFLDADDELAPGALEAMVDGLHRTPQAVVHACSVLDAETGERHRFPHRFALVLARAPRLFAVATAVWSLYPIQGNAALRTEAVRDAGGYADCTGGEDWILATCLAFRGRVVLDPRPGRLYHRHPDSLLERTSGTGEVLAASTRLRRRLARDPALPTFVRAALPALALAQWILITVVRPPYRLVGRALARRRGHPERRV